MLEFLLCLSASAAAYTNMAKVILVTTSTIRSHSGEELPNPANRDHLINSDYDVEPVLQLAFPLLQ